MVNLLSNLSKIVARKKKRLGRGLGSGRGSKSGRGTTRHQKARESIPLHFEGGQARMVKKYPLLRGKGRNKSIQVLPFLFNLNDLNKFKEGDVVDVEALIKKGLLSEENKKARIKILATGKLDKKLTVKVPVSQMTKKAIERVGGKVEL